jgi:hypothetical protein
MNTNLAIRLKSGGVVDVLYPLKVGMAMVNDHSSAVWDINLYGLRNDFVNGLDYAKKAELVIGNEKNEILESIALSAVWNIENLSAEKLSLAMQREKKSKEERLLADENNPERPVLLKDLQAMEKRIMQMLYKGKKG